MPGALGCAKKIREEIYQHSQIIHTYIYISIYGVQKYLYFHNSRHSYRIQYKRDVVSQIQNLKKYPLKNLSLPG